MGAALAGRVAGSSSVLLGTAALARFSAEELASRPQAVAAARPTAWC